MPRKDEIYTLDRVEGTFAILISSKNERIQVPASEISAREGDRLQYTGQAFILLAESGERAEIKARMDGLFKRR